MNSYHVIQIWCAEKNMANTLIQKMIKVVKKYNGFRLDCIGGCGDFGNFTGVYRAFFPKSYCNLKDIKTIISEFKKITSVDHGGSYYYGSSKVIISEQQAKVTQAELIKDFEFKTPFSIQYLKGKIENEL